MDFGLSGTSNVQPSICRALSEAAFSLMVCIARNDRPILQISMSVEAPPVLHSTFPSFLSTSALCPAIITQTRGSITKICPLHCIGTPCYALLIPSICAFIRNFHRRSKTLEMVDWKSPDIIAVCAGLSCITQLHAALSDFVLQLSSTASHMCISAPTSLKPCSLWGENGALSLGGENSDSRCSCVPYSPQCIGLSLIQVAGPIAIFLHKVDVGCGLCGHVSAV